MSNTIPLADTTNAGLLGPTDQTQLNALANVSIPGSGTLATVNGALGAATATSLNKVAFTQPASGSTLTVDDGKTFRISATLTFQGTDSSTVAFGSGGTVVYLAGNQTFTGGFTATPYNLGSASTWGSNAITLSAANGNMQYATNDHACTITVQSGVSTVQFDIANTTGAGAVTFSGWDLVVGPTIDTTTTSKFACLSKVNQTKVLYITKVA